jgi:RimJ/RimL family protein N-acetyltransferase
MVIVETDRLVVRLFVDGDLDARGLVELRATIDPANRASRRVVEKAGFRAVAERVDVHGQPEIVYALANLAPAGAISGS